MPYCRTSRSTFGSLTCFGLKRGACEFTLYIRRLGTCSERKTNRIWCIACISASFFLTRTVFASVGGKKKIGVLKRGKMIIMVLLWVRCAGFD